MKHYILSLSRIYDTQFKVRAELLTYRRFSTAQLSAITQKEQIDTALAELIALDAVVFSETQRLGADSLRAEQTYYRVRGEFSRVLFNRRGSLKKQRFSTRLNRRDIETTTGWRLGSDEPFLALSSIFLVKETRQPNTRIGF